MDDQELVNRINELAEQEHRLEEAHVGEGLRPEEEERLRKEDEDRNLTEWILRDARQTLSNPNATEKRKAEAEAMIAQYSQPETGN